MFNLNIAAWCLMDTHYHLLVQTPDANLARCMRHIHVIVEILTRGQTET
jgi:putative transposase